MTSENNSNSNRTTIIGLGIAAVSLVLGIALGNLGPEILKAAKQVPSPSPTVDPNLLSGVIVRVDDGDTVVIRQVDGRETLLRLAGVDAPEKGQPFYDEATDALEEAVLNRPAQVVITERNANPFFARITVDGRDVGPGLVQAGFAWASEGSTSDAEYLKSLKFTENQSRMTKVGLWDDPNAALSPWEFRQMVDKGTVDATVIARSVYPSLVHLFTFDSWGQMKTGSGFFISENQIATNFHVIQDGSRTFAKIVGHKEAIEITGVVAFDPDKDLAILQISNFAGFPLRIASGDSPVRSGEKIYALGNPFGLEGSISDGIVSGMQLREIDGQNYIQITAPISSGNSGGPIVNSNGNVVGVATMYLRGGQNLNFAVPVSQLEYMQSRITTPIPVSQVAVRTNCFPYTADCQ
ncbi:MAG: trypsin-like peptidase domain-containing protein [Acidobacteriota bacterium]